MAEQNVLAFAYVTDDTRADVRVEEDNSSTVEGQ